MDTLAISSPDGEPFLYTTKFYLLPHLKMVICGTGIGQFVLDWFVRVNTGMLVRDLCHLDEFTADALREIGSRYSLDQGTVTVYHFGWSELENCFTGFAYRSERDFQSERLEYGSGIKPHFEQTDWFSKEKIAFVEIMKKQKMLDRQQPLSEQVGIGGDIYVLYMGQDGTSVMQLHRFDNYEDEYAQMVNRL